MDDNEDQDEDDYQQVKKNVKNKVEDVKNKAGEYVDQAKSKAGDIKKNVENKVEETKTKLKDGGKQNAHKPENKQNQKN